MKKLNQLRLNQLSKVDLERREMSSLIGGDCFTCACGCSYSSTSSNMSANAGYGYTQTAGWGDGNDACACASYTGNTSDCQSGSFSSGSSL
jgi:natural product precursor